MLKWGEGKGVSQEKCGKGKQKARSGRGLGCMGGRSFASLSVTMKST